MGRVEKPRVGFDDVFLYRKKLVEPYEYFVFDGFDLNLDDVDSVRSDGRGVSLLGAEDVHLHLKISLLDFSKH